MPAASNALRLAELLCARTSHDLGGIIGTLGGALELTDDPAIAEEAMALAAQSATELRQRLELLRACWGPASSPLDLTELRRLAKGLPGARRCSIDLAGLPDNIVFSPPFGRAVLNLLMLATEALNGNGTISLFGCAADVVVSIAGSRAAWPAGIADCLSSEADALAAVRDARSLQMPFTVLLARALNLRLSFLLPVTPGGPAPPLRLCEG